MSRDEATFQTEIKRSFDKFCADMKIKRYYHKPPDLGLRNPFDCYLAYETKNLACLELKNSKNYRNKDGSMNFTAMFGYGKQEHEILNLIKIEKIGFKGFVIVNDFFDRLNNRAYALLPDVAYSFYEFGTINLKTIQRKSIEIPRIKGSMWELSVIL